MQVLQLPPGNMSYNREDYTRPGPRFVHVIYFLRPSLLSPS